MKKYIVLIICIITTLMLKATYSKTVEIVAGGLLSTLTLQERNTVTNLTVIGSLNAVDFVTLRDKMPLLATLDLSGSNIVEYTGTQGTIESNYTYTYPANTIPDYSFGGFSNMTIGGPWNSLWKTIGKTSLISIILPSSITTIGDCAFAGCNKIKSLTIPQSVIYIKPYAFYGCSSLDSIKIPLSVKKIGFEAFVGCSNLQSIFVPSTVVSIEIRAFGGCKGPITVENNNPLYSSLNGVLFNKSQTKILQYPNFKQSTYVIPSTVDTIGALSFAGNTNLKILYIPSTVDIIENESFAGCSELVSIFSNSVKPLTLPASGSSGSLNTVFEGVNKNNCTIYVLKGSRESYLAAEYWNEFSNIVEGSGIAFSSKSIDISTSAAHTDTLDVFSNTNWKATSDKSWLTVSPDSSIAGYSKIIINTTNNQEYFDRVARISFIVDSLNDQVISVTQGAKVAAFNLHILPGELGSSLNSIEKSKATSLTISGAIDARDFRVMRDSMPLLNSLNIKDANIIEYTGNAGTSGSITTTYPANTLPDYSFFNSTTSKGKTTLLSVTFSPSINSIGSFAFKNCSMINALILPSAITSIGQHAFYGCSSLDSITIPTSVTYIGSSAFKNCTRLALIKIPKFVNAIADNTFMGCVGLRSVSIPSSVNFIGDYAFSNCSGLDSLTIPSSITIIGDYAFNGCSILKSVIIPSTIDTASVSIRQYAFSNCLKLASITLPTFLVKIGDFAFQNCKVLDSILIPKSVESIGNYAFKSCNALKTISFSENSSAKIIGDNAFQNCYSLKSIVIPSNVISIGSNSFDACLALNNIDFSHSLSLKKIGNYIFQNCSALDSVILGSKITSIGNYSFYNCTALKFVMLPNSISSIGSSAFMNCCGLTYVIIPESITNIEDNVFYGCSGLTSIKLSQSILKIGSQAFRNCSSLDSITIPSLVKYIGNLAFYGCIKLSTATIPSSVTFIGERAFYGCSGLKKLFVFNPQPIALSSSAVFEDVDKTSCTLYVPADSKDEYQAANVWNEFSNIIDDQLPTVFNNLKLDNVIIYQKPVTDDIYISGNKGLCNITIVDISGNMIIKRLINNNDCLNISSLPKGVYIIKIAGTKDKIIRKIFKR
ncbi:MAG: leucine-rich repeat protein [Bacteroidota bacterium]|nr:leucine-rich repeat protein [Bacteroidota bacterium]